MKFLLITLAIIGYVAAAQLPDSATQGPNPQDIATPEPEYIDIDLPEPAPAPKRAAPAPLPVRSNFISAPRPVQRPVQRTVARPIVQQQGSIAHSIAQSYVVPQQPQLVQQQQVQYQPQQVQYPGHVYNRQHGYQYRRPAYVKRVVYRRRY